MDANPSLFALPAKTFFKIGEVAEILGVKPYVLRYWESEFKPLSPQKSNQSHHRMYTREDIGLLMAIKGLLYEDMYTIAGARRQLTELQRAGDVVIEGSVEDVQDPLDGVERAAFEQQVEDLHARLGQATQDCDEALELAREAGDAVAEVALAREAAEECTGALGAELKSAREENSTLQDALAEERGRVSELEAQRSGLLDAAWPAEEGPESSELISLREVERDLRAMTAERAASRLRLVHNLRGKVNALIEFAQPFQVQEEEASVGALAVSEQQTLA
jgi:DNA-binding transcriptional MerR regulator